VLSECERPNLVPGGRQGDGRKQAWLILSQMQTPKGQLDVKFALAHRTVERESQQAMSTKAIDMDDRDRFLLVGAPNLFSGQTHNGEQIYIASVHRREQASRYHLLGLEAPTQSISLCSA
jgi:hypothetical protein